MITIKTMEIAKAIGICQQFVVDIKRGKKQLPKKRREALIEFYENKIKEIKKYVKSLDF